MRTNNYVVSQLIDWSAVPDDPMFQLTFPQPGEALGEEKYVEPRKFGRVTEQGGRKARRWLQANIHYKQWKVIFETRVFKISSKNIHLQKTWPCINASLWVSTMTDNVI